MIRLSWACAAVVALALTACSLTPRDELSPRQAMAPTPPDGVAVGVAVVARTPSTDWTTAHGLDVYLTFRGQNGGGGELTFARETFPQMAEYEATENGLAVAYRPFAIKLKAGSGEFLTFANRYYKTTTRQEMRSVPTYYKDSHGVLQTKWERKWETVYESHPIVSATTVPAAAFDVEPGKVLYIGRIGMLVHVEKHLGPGPHPCRAGSPQKIPGFEVPCLVRRPFISSEADTDLAMIRQRFPKLAGVEIEVRPIQAAPGWPSLSEAARPFMAGL